MLDHALIPFTYDIGRLITTSTWAVKLSWLSHANVWMFFGGILTCKVGQTDLGSLIGLCMQDYKSLCADVAISHTQAAFDQLI